MVENSHVRILIADDCTVATHHLFPPALRAQYYTRRVLNLRTSVSLTTYGYRTVIWSIISLIFNHRQLIHDTCWCWRLNVPRVREPYRRGSECLVFRSRYVRKKRDFFPPRKRDVIIYSIIWLLVLESRIFARSNIIGKIVTNTK